ncbi:MAG: Hpt domain-containing protein [Chloroflexota bacterium]
MSEQPRIELPDDVIEYEALQVLADPDAGGDAEFLTEIIDLFLIDSPPRVEKILAAAECEPEQAARVAHSLRSSCANLGARRLELICARIDELGKHAAGAGITELAAMIPAEYEAAARLLKAERDRVIRLAA